MPEFGLDAIYINFNKQEKNFLNSYKE